MTTSPQKYHSSRCEIDSIGRPAWEDQRKALYEERKRKELRISLDTKPTLSIEKPATQEEKTTIIKEKKPKELDLGNTTMQTKKSLTKSEQREDAKTSNITTRFSAATTTPTESTSSEKSWKRVKSDSLTEVLPALSETLNQEQSESMSLINSSVKQLKTVLDSVVVKNKTGEDKNFSSKDIADICKLSTSITGLMKVKVDAVKAAADVIRATTGN
jgi:hypothetical protein